jgi:hypothetical protein
MKAEMSEASTSQGAPKLTSSHRSEAWANFPCSVRGKQSRPPLQNSGLQDHQGLHFCGGGTKAMVLLRSPSSLMPSWHTLFKSPHPCVHPCFI